MGAVVAAVVVFALLVVVIIATYCCIRNKRSSKYDVKKSADVELGVKTPSKPVLGGKWDIWVCSTELLRELE